ncbi:hypothetical protein [Cronobacter sakazakii]|uniref:hypothetical protein n=1 Tax=Cronobacter sakazakii TaxID=28141 RepID=UPI0020778726|nr:hypothetical protein [Cronobacter sakazakii]USI30422.1 hypothetical protein NES82_10680 [Cronobacter sakazakii]
MRKFRFIVIAFLIIYLLFGAVVFIDGIRSLMRSDMEILLYSGFIAALLGLIALMFPPKNGGTSSLKDNFIFLWMERKRLEEKKRIDELKR